MQQTIQPQAFGNNDAYEWALSVYRAGRLGQEMPEIPEQVSSRGEAAIKAAKELYKKAHDKFRKYGA